MATYMTRKNINLLIGDEMLQYRADWERLGIELRFAENLVREILCDDCYNRLVDKKRWDRLFKVIEILMRLRAGCEDRMAEKIDNWSTYTFYPFGEVSAYEHRKVLEVRAWAKDEAINAAKEKEKEGMYV